jgi:uncharacterized protein
MARIFVRRGNLCCHRCRFVCRARGRREARARGAHYRHRRGQRERTAGLRIVSGVTTRAKTAKEASDADAKAMAAVLAALQAAGIEQKDVQTSRFSIAPVYASPGPNMEQRLTGFSVSNQVSVTIRQIDKVGDILDRLVTAGANDAGNVEFLHADPSKTLDRAREAAMADARRKAELYARAAGLPLGGVAWVTEDSSAPVFRAKVAMHAAMPASVPIAAGEDTLQVRITVGFEIGR